MMLKAPSFYFRVISIQETPESVPRSLGQGIWFPPAHTGSSQATLPQWFYYDGTAVIAAATIPPGLYEYGTYSVYYDDSKFWAVPYNVLQIPVATGENYDWNRVMFSHGEVDGTASRVTLGGEHWQLGPQHHQHQQWIRMLFPENHHPDPSMNPPNYSSYGGLSGDLPLVLALIAFSIEPQYIYHAFQHCLTNHSWQAHQYRHGRRNKRGMMVSVYATGLQNSTPQILRFFDNTKIFS
ncbi:uncharacterized protein K452DRAFT_309982 [Aplosporella prunicola CBS 121167]|uniref:Uncharacterized protein n=1 Tax=Aplosporella prunicola CBS 121167 TaxID=1176127 RepID=A0A6A6BA78_9PEZI|nr:uncharacterized protein K452DRAFT_309982 [Aplosporella prunicola CBS 121167]KAF2140205.1 hypothetical protein K452DRAFT_309982 [Aplosporella prunicola CBS 121167]